MNAERWPGAACVRSPIYSDMYFLVPLSLSLSSFHPQEYMRLSIDCTRSFALGSRTQRVYNLAVAQCESSRITVRQPSHGPRRRVRMTLMWPVVFVAVVVSQTDRAFYDSIRLECVPLISTCRHVKYCLVAIVHIMCSP